MINNKGFWSHVHIHTQTNKFTWFNNKNADIKDMKRKKKKLKSMELIKLNCQGNDEWKLHSRLKKVENIPSAEAGL